MVGLKVESDFYPIGESDFFLSFFDNIHYHLELDKEWGSKFPILLGELYQKGKMRLKDIDEGTQELLQVREEFKKILPDKIVWDINDLNKRPTWGYDISDEITNLSNYFVTNDGRNLFDLILEALNMGKIYKWDVIVWNMFKPIYEQPKPDQLQQ